MEDVCKAVLELLEAQAGLQLKADAYQFDVSRMKVDGVVMEAMKAGKLAPFQQDWAFQSAMNDPDSFALWLNSAPQVVPMGKLNLGQLTTEHRTRPRTHELLGLSTEDVAKYGN